MFQNNAQIIQLDSPPLILFPIPQVVPLPESCLKPEQAGPVPRYRSAVPATETSNESQAKAQITHIYIGLTLSTIRWGLLSTDLNT
jgi:hypothetical protein